MLGQGTPRHLGGYPGVPTYLQLVGQVSLGLAGIDSGIAERLLHLEVALGLRHRGLAQQLRRDLLLARPRLLWGHGRRWGTQGQGGIQKDVGTVGDWWAWGHCRDSRGCRGLGHGDHGTGEVRGHWGTWGQQGTGEILENHGHGDIERGPIRTQGVGGGQEETKEPGDFEGGHGDI